MSELYLPERADDRIEELVEANPDFEIRGWCLYCGSDRLMVNTISRPCQGCGAEFGLVNGPDHLRPPRPGEVSVETPGGMVSQGTLFDA